MSKYYVKSGQIKFIIDCTTHECAIMAALTYYKGKGYMTGPRICVSEKGFDDIQDWKCYDIDDYMRKV